MTEAVLTDDADGVLVITINRPEARNAVDGAVARGMAAALDELDGRRRPAGRRADRRGRHVLRRDGPEGVHARREAGDPRPRLRRHHRARRRAKPLIAAVEGYALAGGFEIVLACDLVVAAESSKFGVPEVKRGLVAAAAALLRLPRRIPYTAAMELR